MRPFRGLTTTGVVMLALAAVGLIACSIFLNAVVHTEAFRQEVETRASRTLGSPVEIKQIDFSIWSGVRLRGLAVKLDSSRLNQQGTLTAQVESVSCSCSFLGLLRHRLQLEGMTVVNPQVVLTQLPASEVPTPQPPPVAATAESKSGEVAVAPAPAFQFSLETARIINGNFAIQDAGGITKADLQGVQVSTRTAGYYSGGDITGTIKIATILLPQNLRLTDFSTPFTYRDGQVQTAPLAASAFGGQLTGDYKIEPGATSLLELNATGIDMLQIGAAANPDSSTKLSGLLALQSTWHGAETGKLAGEGDAQISNGRLQGVSLLRDLAIALRVPGLSEPVLNVVSTHFEVADGSTRFSRLDIESADFAMTGHGTIDAQGRLDADMVLILHGAAMGGIPGTAASFFAKLPGGGGSIPFHLGGTVGNPEADLSTRFFLQGSKVEKTINRAINRLFH